jgi:hypothetical protein
MRPHCRHWHFNQLMTQQAKFIAKCVTALAAMLVPVFALGQTPADEQLPEPFQPPQPELGPSVAKFRDAHPTDEGAQNFAPEPTFADQRSFAPEEPCEPECNCPNGPAYPYTSGHWWRNGAWYGEVDFLVWHRSRARPGTLGVDTSTNVGIGADVNLNRHGTSLGVEPGGQATLGYFIDRDIDNRDHSIEFTYLGFNNWQSLDGLVAASPQALRAPEAPNFGGFNFADTYSTFYRSSLQTMWLNYRLRNRPDRDRMVMGPDGFWSRQIAPGRTQSLVVGLVGVEVDERFDWLSLQNGVSPTVFSGNYKVHTQNSLIGPQIGGDCYDVHERWYWGIRGNAAPLVSFSRGTADVLVNDPNAPEAPIHGRATSQTPGFFGELSFLAGLSVSENVMIFSSYNMAAVGGLAMAPDQISFTDKLAGKPPTLVTGSGIFYQGFSVGLEAYW